MKYILILTLITSGGNNGQGGVATAEFDTRNSCAAAGELWQDTLDNSTSGSSWRTPNNRGSFYICVPSQGGE